MGKTYVTNTAPRGSIEVSSFPIQTYSTWTSSSTCSHLPEGVNDLPHITHQQTPDPTQTIFVFEATTVFTFASILARALSLLLQAWCNTAWRHPMIWIFQKKKRFSYPGGPNQVYSNPTTTKHQKTLKSRRAPPLTRLEPSFFQLIEAGQCSKAMPARRSKEKPAPTFTVTSGG